MMDRPVECPIAVVDVVGRITSAANLYVSDVADIACVPMPDEAVSISPAPLDSVLPGCGEVSAGVATRAWRIDVNAVLQQPEDRALAFQEQDTFAADRALEITCSLSDHAAHLLMLHQHKEWWMRPCWTLDVADIPQRTQMILGQDVLGRWMCLLAICGDDVRADWCAASPCGTRDGRGGNGDRLCLTISVNRSGRIALQDTVAYVAVSVNPYEAIHACAASAAGRVSIAAREHRDFPASLTGLGWCTWDSLGRDVSEAAIIAKMREFRAKHVPIAWVLIDDGWSATDREKETLQDFTADCERFPQGLRHTVQVLKSEYGVRSVGVWQSYQGYWRGIDRDGAVATLMRESVCETANRCVIPSGRYSEANRFWNEWNSRLKAAGVDFVKVDSQSSTSVMTRGAESYGESTKDRHRALDDSVERYFDGALINCMGMAPEDYWHRPTSPITRSSDDYLPDSPDSFAEHIMQNAYCALLMNEMYHCDWDMFWTDHPQGRAHAILRAVSGGPVYCSDAIGHTDADVLQALLSEDGTLRRPDLPARPLPASLLEDPTQSDNALALEARFGETDVLLFVGVRHRPQKGTYVCEGGECMLTDIQTGVVMMLRPNERWECDVDFGEVRVISCRRANRNGA